MSMETVDSKDGVAVGASEPAKSQLPDGEKRNKVSTVHFFY